MAQLESIADAATAFLVAVLDSPQGADLSNVNPDVKKALATLWQELDAAGRLEPWRRERWADVVRVTPIPVGSHSMRTPL